jgi:hypothetical protein
MENDAERLTLEELERTLMTMAERLSDSYRLKPTQLWVHPSQIRIALKLLGWLKGPVRKVKGIRARKRALYWRTTK